MFGTYMLQLKGYPVAVSRGTYSPSISNMIWLWARTGSKTKDKGHSRGSKGLVHILKCCVYGPLAQG